MKLTVKVFSVFMLVSLWSCDRFKTTTTPEGDRLIVHESGKDAKKGKDGDLLTFDLVIKNSSDSVLSDTYKTGQPAMGQLRKGQFKGSFENALYHIGVGDSVTVLVKADSMFKAPAQMPPSVKKGTDLKFIVKMNKIQTVAEFQKEMAEKKTNEPKIINEYVAKNMKGALKTAEGLQYVVKVPGAGKIAAKGDSVTVAYVGKFIDGKIFDQSKPGQPFTFPVGNGMVIPGWEKALMMMKAGEKSTFVIPSSLGYGEQGAGGVIPPNTPLVFEIELIKIGK